MNRVLELIKEKIKSYSTIAEDQYKSFEIMHDGYHYSFALIHKGFIDLLYGDRDYRGNEGEIRLDSSAVLYLIHMPDGRMIINDLTDRHYDIEGLRDKLPEDVMYLSSVVEEENRVLKEQYGPEFLANVNWQLDKDVYLHHCMDEARKIRFGIEEPVGPLEAFSGIDLIDCRQYVNLLCNYSDIETIVKDSLEQNREKIAREKAVLEYIETLIPEAVEEYEEELFSVLKDTTAKNVTVLCQLLGN